MSMKVDIQRIADDEFFVVVPLEKDSGTVMVATMGLLRTSGEEVLRAGRREGGFRIKLIMKEGTFSALQGAVTNALEGLTIGAHHYPK